MSKREPEQEAKKVAQAIADEIGKFMAAQGNPDIEVHTIPVRQAQRTS